MPLRIWLATSATAPAEWGRKTVCALEFAAMSRSVSKYWVIRRSSEIFSVERFSPVPWVIESRSPSMIARRWRAMPSPWSWAASAAASAAFTTLIFSASAAMTDASRRWRCLLISFMDATTEASGTSSVTKALWIWKPYAAISFMSLSWMAREMSSFFSKASSRVIIGTCERTTSETYASICTWTLVSLYMACSTHSGFTDCCTATLAMTKTLSLVLVWTRTWFCSTREVIERKEMQQPQMSKPAKFKPGGSILLNFPKFSTAKYLSWGTVTQQLVQGQQPRSICCAIAVLGGRRRSVVEWRVGA